MPVAPKYLKINYSTDPIQEEANVLLPFADSPLLSTRIKGHKLLTSGKDVKRVYDVALDRQNIDYAYKPGDAIGILCENDEHEVDLIMDSLNLLEVVDQTYSLTIIEGTIKKKPAVPSHIPSKGTLRSVFRKYLDIRSVPKKLFLKVLAEYTSNKEEKDELLSLTDQKQSAKYTKFIASEGATLLSILRKFQSCKPPVERLFEHLQSLKPRYYSISSSPLAKDNCIHITFAVLDLNDGFKGVCTGYLENVVENLSENTIIRFYFRTSSNFLHFEPETMETPLILIGPGTGVAPFVGLFEERYLLRDTFNFGESLLFFGCRYAERDFLYKDELDKYLDCGIIGCLYTAFSRDASEKVYVQDKIKEHGRQISDLLVYRGAGVRICGDAKLLMKCVDDAFANVLIEYENMDQGQANDFIIEIKRSNRYQIDIWT